MTLREATWWDAWRIWRWRNDPSGRAMMRNTGRVGPIEHILWFRRMLRDGNVDQYIIVDANHVVGSGRLDYAPSFRWVALDGTRTSPGAIQAEIDIVIAPGERGEGHAKHAIKLLVEAARQRGARIVTAVVRMNNVASYRVFQRARFVIQETEYPFYLMVLE